MPQTRLTAEKFWSRVDKSAGPDGCWPWTGSLTNSGYGKTISIPEIYIEPRKETTAHRQAFVLTYGDPGTYLSPRTGKPFPLQIRHHCPGGPNRACCNPKHLSYGTAQQNVKDKISDGNLMQGTACHRAKFNPELIRTVRYMYDNKIATAIDLGKAYSVSVSCIYSIVGRYKWKHVK